MLPTLSDRETVGRTSNVGERGAARSVRESDGGYDVFVAAPMSAYQQDAKAYSDNRERLINLFSALRARTALRHFFCPAVEVPSLDKFDPNDHALVQDLLALEASQVFILYYLPPLPTKPSSVFVEAGMALLARMPSVFIVRSKSDLPYMLSNADQISLERLMRAGSKRQPLKEPERLPARPFVKIMEVGDSGIIDTVLLSDWLNSTARDLQRMQGR